MLRFYGVVVESYAEPNVIGIMTEYMKGGSLAAFLRWAFADNCNGKQANFKLIFFYFLSSWFAQTTLCS